MPRAKEFNAAENPVFVVLAKVLDATRNKQKLSDRDRYKGDPSLEPGQHRARGKLDFDVTYTVGEDAEAMRSYGTPIDSILLYAFLLSGALREHFIRAAMVLKEIRTAELEGEDEQHPRPYQDIDYTFKRIVTQRGKRRLVETPVHIPADQVAEAADLIAGKLTGEETDEDRALVLEQVADCLAKLKVKRKYDGPINLEDIEQFALHEFANIRVAAA